VHDWNTRCVRVDERRDLDVDAEFVSRIEVRFGYTAATPDR
jgi:hypothetical protein